MTNVDLLCLNAEWGDFQSSAPNVIHDSNEPSEFNNSPCGGAALKESADEERESPHSRVELFPEHDADHETGVVERNGKDHLFVETSSRNGNNNNNNTESREAAPIIEITDMVSPPSGLIPSMDDEEPAGDAPMQRGSASKTPVPEAPAQAPAPAPAPVTRARASFPAVPACSEVQSEGGELFSELDPMKIINAGQSLEQWSELSLLDHSVSSSSRSTKNRHPHQAHPPSTQAAPALSMAEIEQLEPSVVIPKQEESGDLMDFLDEFDPVPKMDPVIRPSTVSDAREKQEEPIITSPKNNDTLLSSVIHDASRQAAVGSKQPAVTRDAKVKVALQPPETHDFSPDPTSDSPPKSPEHRPAVESEDVVLEDHEKKSIAVYDKGEKHMVGWYADTCKADIREAILCACDAIMNSGFVLREVTEGSAGDDDTVGANGRVYEFEDFDQLRSGFSYILEPAKEREDLKDITGDKNRRLQIQIEPMLHVEAQKAVENMRRGANLLKHTRYGFPHLRQFQLSEDRKRLLWYSGAKTKNDSVIIMDSVDEILLGQQTATFSNYRLPMLEHLSFSIKHNGKTLDLTCKDEFEFDHWVTGLKALLYHNKNRMLSKAELLAHSKRFEKAIKKNNLGIKLTTLPEVREKGHVGLDDCIEIVSHTTSQLDAKLDRLRERLKAVSAQVSKLDFHASAEMEVDVAILSGQGPAYASVFREIEDSQDEEMEIRRMLELVEETSGVLQTAQNELLALQKQKDEEEREAAEARNSDAPPTVAGRKEKKRMAKGNKYIDQLLWKAEVDLENVEDMYVRHLDNPREATLPFSVSVAEINARLSRTAQEVEDVVLQKFREMRGWFGP